MSKGNSFLSISLKFQIFILLKLRGIEGNEISSDN